LERILKKTKDFNELVMFEHSIFSLPFIFIAMVVSANGWFGFWLLFGEYLSFCALSHCGK